MSCAGERVEFRASKRRLLPLGCAAGIGVVLVSAATPASAQATYDNRPGFSVERYVPPPGPAVFFCAEGADVLPQLQLSLGASGSLMSRPMVLENIYDRSEVSEPVRLRLGFDFLAAIGITDRLQLGVGMPVIAAQDGSRLQGLDLDETPLRPVALGDLRVHGKVRWWGRAGQAGGGIGVSMALTLPTGDEEHFAGERGAVFEWHAIGSWRWPGRGAVAVNLGQRLRSEKVVLLAPARPHGDEIVGLFAAEAGVPWTARDQLRALLEYAFVAGDPGPAGSIRGPSPEEVRFGARWRMPAGVSVGGGLGFGTSPNEVGSPAWRVIASVSYDSAPTSDLDRDGIPDRLDRCRMRAEDRDGFEDTDGCPDLDNDGDGIPDREDECPNEAEDYDRHRDMDGCPDAEQRLPREPVPDFATGS